MVIIITAHPHINKIITSRCRMWIALMLLGLFLIDWTAEQSEQFVTYRFLCKNIGKVTQIDTLWHKTRWNQVKCARFATKLCIWLSWLEPNFQWRLNFQFFFSGSGHPWSKDSMKITIIVIRNRQLYSTQPFMLQPKTLSINVENFFFSLSQNNKVNISKGEF